MKEHTASAHPHTQKSKPPDVLILQKFSTEQENTPEGANATQFSRNIMNIRYFELCMEHSHVMITTLNREPMKFVRLPKNVCFFYGRVSQRKNYFR